MITARNLTKRFSDVVALDHLNCNIPNGCIYGLVGANGAGKSTFLRLMSGIYRPDEGAVCIDGGEIYENVEVKKHFVFVPDELFFLPQSTMDRMAKLYATVYERFDKDRYQALAQTFRLQTDKPLNTFSKGMRRQAAVILALSTMSEYIFFDETFDGLDPVMRNLVKQTLYADVVDRGCTVVVTSHSLRELEDTCDQLALLYKGGIVFESDVQNIKTSLFKLQVAFDTDFDQTAFADFEVLSYTKQGKVANLIMRGDREACSKAMAEKSPLLMEILPLALEEVFIYEMEALGYAFEEARANGGVKHE